MYLFWGYQMAVMSYELRVMSYELWRCSVVRLPVGGWWKKMCLFVK